MFFCFVATPFCLLLALASAGAGHGDYFWAKIIYPYTMLSAIFLNSISIPAALVAIVQLPMYGVVLSVDRLNKPRSAVLALFSLHTLTLLACFAISHENFRLLAPTGHYSGQPMPQAALSMPIDRQVKDQDVFTSVPAALRAGLSERLKLLIEYQRTQQWEKQYELLSSSSKQGDTKEQYAKRNRHWYTEVVPEDLILDFVPRATTTHESLAEAGWWTISGCAQLHRKGKTERLYASVDAHREGGNWYFSTLGVVTPLDGMPQPCPYPDLLQE